MKLNCDLGEGADCEVAVMPFIDQANIACGAHAGNPELIRETMALAQQHGVSVGAHPGYPDRERFGRVSMDLPPEKIRILVLESSPSTVARSTSTDQLGSSSGATTSELLTTVSPAL